MSAKLSFIDPYFERWRGDIDRASELLQNDRFYLEAILVLSCYIGAFAAMRFPAHRDGERYTKMVLVYSGKQEFYEQLDLLFLCQWERSKLRDHGEYRDLKNYAEILNVISAVYGSEYDIKSGHRYIPVSELLSQIQKRGIPAFDIANFSRRIKLFSLAELLYRYIRCDAVHDAHYVFVDRVENEDGQVTYRDNHAISGQILLETTRGICESLWQECHDHEKWPWEF